MAYVEVQFSNEKVLAQVTSGFVVTVFSKKLADRLKLTPLPGDSGKVEADSFPSLPPAARKGAYLVKEVVSLNVGSVVVEVKPLVIPNTTLDLVLGLDWLAKVGGRFNYENQTMGLSQVPPPESEINVYDPRTSMRNGVHVYSEWVTDRVAKTRLYKVLNFHLPPGPGKRTPTMPLSELMALSKVTDIEGCDTSRNALEWLISGEINPLSYNFSKNADAIQDFGLGRIDVEVPLVHIADEEQGQARAAPKSEKAKGPKAGPNEPCPCGSGRKFKKCCRA
mmetsp:Transcript_33122/g.55493  ORF Transcript_33122/g.55493 Transcript_33122/m.55493 type:complete len:279 (+) Transcript_33122:288-1124(+)|eukprot:CAMPEP_0198206272 /NCGR_PEP_ID=MMETSP1445-20131203/9809_1 /TAXON_ID=36898 /ORGANISM="Pyramimonas sp., Strain CCMP2087" /LENGTH=278 /DNA_ID=CAMNT_0043878901 /DNA_START=282 /DNA_END=1118 /DNA_ORIENTATION=-